MKATLEFNLPDEEEEFRNAINGTRYRTVLSHLDECMRTILKYDDPPDVVFTVVEKLRNELHEALSAENLEL